MVEMVDNLYFIDDKIIKYINYFFLNSKYKKNILILLIIHKNTN
jgi:hypothetical protein